MTRLVADYYQLDVSDLTQVVKGPKKGLKGRKVAMYLSQQLGGHKLEEITVLFGLSSVGSVSYTTSQLRKRLNDSASLEKEIQKIKHYIIDNAT
jgi:chromosomal replication initiation ATPase DnaA